MTHDELVLVACRWLARKHRCTHVFAEPNAMYLSELPDAIGYRYGASMQGTRVIECKTSLEDFRRDSSKTWRKHSPGMGRWRWYLVPEGLIEPGDVPEDHGLLYVSGRKVTEAKPAPPREEFDHFAEMTWICRAFARWRQGDRWIANEYRFETEHERARCAVGELHTSQEEVNGA